MTKNSAFGTILSMGDGSVQVETATVAGTIASDGAGNVDVTITAANLTGSPLTLEVPVANNDTASIVAGKIRDFIRTDATAAPVRALFDVSGATTAVILTRKIPMANDSTLNIAIQDGTSDGIETAATSANTNAGETLAAVAQISNISGPALAADTEDVTTHDSPGAWEESVVTILRTGEVTLEIVYDPGEETHDASTGLLSMLDARTPAGFSIEFPDETEWAFAAFVTGFEPSAPVDGALTASVTLKVTGAPILA